MLEACRWLGVDHVFLTDNEADPALSLMGAPELASFVAGGFLSMRVEREPQAQMSVYKRCIERRAHKFDWMAFFDLDEFLILRRRCAAAHLLHHVCCHQRPMARQLNAPNDAQADEAFNMCTSCDARRLLAAVEVCCSSVHIRTLQRHARICSASGWCVYMRRSSAWRGVCRQDTLKKLLNDFKMFPGLAVHWVVFGPNNRKRRPSQGGVLRHYTRCRPEAATHVKTIVNTFFVERTTIHPHNFEYRCESTRCCWQQGLFSTRPLWAAPAGVASICTVWLLRGARTCGHNKHGECSGMTSAVNEARLPLGHQYGITPSRCRQGWTSRACAPIPTASLPRSKASVERVALFHYTTRSREDFDLKMARAGGLNPRGKPLGYFTVWAKCASLACCLVALIAQVLCCCWRQLAHCHWLW